MGLDLGTERVGVAISNTDRTVATPLEVVVKTLEEVGEMNGADEKLKELDEKIERLKTKRRRLDAQRKQRSRKEETRRKILLGSMLLEVMKHPQWRDTIKPMIKGYLKRKGDQELFTEEWWEKRFGASEKSG